MGNLIKFFKNDYLWLILIVLLSLYVRLYKIDNPIADWHSWRQADTAAVARNFYREGFNPFLPRGDDMSKISELKPVLNLERYRMVEFPIYPSLVYAAYFLNGGVDEKLARFVSVLFSLGSIVFLYFIVKRYASSLQALLTSFVFGLLPYNIYFSRVTLPEPSLIFFSMGMIYYVDRWIAEKKINVMIPAIIFTACAFLTKPYAVFFLAPLAYSYYLKEGFKFPAVRYWVFALFAFVPFGLWRIWIFHHAEGVPASTWLLNGTGIRFRPAFFRWIVGDRLGREILSIAGGFLFFLGFIVKPLKKPNYLLHLLTISSFLYVIIFATGNVTHDYYQILLTPVLAIFVARGIYLLTEGLPIFLPRIVTIPFAVFMTALMLFLTWGEVKGLYQINNYSIVKAGQAADRLLPKDAIVIAPYNGDTALLYNINRHGFPVVVSTVEEMMRDYGVTALVSTTNDAKTAWLAGKYTLLEKTDEYIIVDLTKRSNNFEDKGLPEPP